MNKNSFTAKEIFFKQNYCQYLKGKKILVKKEILIAY